MAFQVLNRDADRGQKVMMATATVPALSASATAYAFLLPPVAERVRVLGAWYQTAAAGSGTATLDIITDDGTTETALASQVDLTGATANALTEITVEVGGDEVVVPGESVQVKIATGATSSSGITTVGILYVIEPAY